MKNTRSHELCIQLCEMYENILRKHRKLSAVQQNNCANSEKQFSCILKIFFHSALAALKFKDDHEPTNWQGPSSAFSFWASWTVHGPRKFLRAKLRFVFGIHGPASASATDQKNFSGPSFEFVLWTHESWVHLDF